MSTKSLSILFFFLSIWYLPVYYFFFYSNSNTEISSSNDFFHKFSLGNTGQTENACEAVNFAIQNRITFSCQSGYAQLTELKYVGVAKNNKTTCETVTNSFESDVPDLF